MQQRRRNFELYSEAFRFLPEVQLQEEPNEAYYSNRWLSTLLIDNSKYANVSRESVRLALESRNIESRPLWKPMHLQPVFADAPFYGDGTCERLFEKGLCLPSGSNLSEADIRKVIRIFKDCFSLQVSA